MYWLQLQDGELGRDTYSQNPKKKKQFARPGTPLGSWSEGNGSCLSVLLVASSGQILELLTRLYVHMPCQSRRLLKVAASIAPSCSLLPSPSTVDKGPKEKPFNLVQMMSITVTPGMAAVLLGFSLVVCWRIVVRWKAHVRSMHRSTSLHLINVFQVDVPAIGYTFPGLSMLSAIRACFHYKEMMQEGYTKVNAR